MGKALVGTRSGSGEGIATETAALSLAQENAIRAALEASRAPATRRAYRGSWAQFLAWADGEGLQALPAPPTAVAAYLAHRSEDGRSLATLRMDRQAIRAAHIEAGEPDPTASEGVRRGLRGLSRQRAGEGEGARPPRSPPKPSPRFGPRPPRPARARPAARNPPRRPGDGEPWISP